MKKFFGIENCGDPLPENWNVICDFLNSKYVEESEGLEERELEHLGNDIWNRYWEGAYEDAPEAVLLSTSHDYDDLVKAFAEGWEYGLSQKEWAETSLEDIKEAMEKDKIYDTVPEDQFERFCKAVLRKVHADSEAADDGDYINY